MILPLTIVGAYMSYKWSTAVHTQAHSHAHMLTRKPQNDACCASILHTSTQLAGIKFNFYKCFIFFVGFSWKYLTETRVWHKMDSCLVSDMFYYFFLFFCFFLILFLLTKYQTVTIEFSLFMRKWSLYKNFFPTFLLILSSKFCDLTTSCGLYMLRVIDRLLFVDYDKQNKTYGQ